MSSASELSAQPEDSQLAVPGLLGSAVVEERLTLFLDTAGLLAAVVAGTVEVRAEASELVAPCHPS